MKKGLILFCLLSVLVVPAVFSAESSGNNKNNDPNYMVQQLMLNDPKYNKEMQESKLKAQEFAKQNPQVMKQLQLQFEKEYNRQYNQKYK